MRKLRLSDVESCSSLHSKYGIEPRLEPRPPNCQSLTVGAEEAGSSCE